MPVEIIKELQRQRAELEARQKQEQENAELRARQAKEAAEQLEREKIQSRTRFITQQSHKFIEDTGVLFGLQRTERELLEGNVEEHQVNFVPEKGKAVLAWGKGIKLGIDGSPYTSDGSDFSAVEINADPDKETLTVIGKEITVLQKRELGDRRKVETAIAKAYVDPKRHVYSPPSYDRENDMGCCCGA